MGKTGRPKGGTNREWSKEDKYEVIRQVLEGELTTTEVIKKERVSWSQLYKWIHAYEDKGLEGLKNKKKPGNPLAKYHNKKNLTDLEKLQYENMKLRIENERLKKGYTNEEAMSIKRKKS